MPNKKVLEPRGERQYFFNIPVSLWLAQDPETKWFHCEGAIVPLQESYSPAISYHYNLCVVATSNVCLVMGELPHSLCWEHPRWGCLQHWQLSFGGTNMEWCNPGIAVSNVRGKSSKQLDCLSWSSVLARSQTRFTTFLIYFCFSHLAKKKGFWFEWVQTLIFGGLFGQMPPWASMSRATSG